jgi:CO/xanthine dehydrogenase Mo-binding subunit
LGFNFTTAGSRGTAAGSMAAVKASRDAITRMCEVAARIWEVEPDQVVWEDGHARPASANVGDFEPLSIAEIAMKAGFFGGTIAGHAEINVTGGGPGFGTHLIDVEVDRETGAVKVLRYTIIQDAGKAVFPEYVKAQFHGAAVQGIGMALNEEYIYDENGIMENPGFLDYRVPVASDVPYIDTQIVEVPNPNHPYGIRGVGEVPIIPPLAAISNAIYDAVGIRMRDHPMSPPKVLAALDEAAPAAAAE